jgi:hypothetical protein
MESLKLSTPSGFGIPLVSSPLGRTTANAVRKMVRKTASHATGRQRRETRRPSGKKSGRNVVMAMRPGYQTQYGGEAMTRARGNEPGSVRRPKIAYWRPNSPSVKHSA